MNIVTFGYDRGRLRCVLALLAVLGAALVLPTRADAGGAFVVEDAEVDKPGTCKVETWFSYADNGDRIWVASPACGVPIFGKPFEFNAQIQRSRSAGEWGTELAVQAKTGLFEVGKVAAAIQGGTTYDLITHQHTGTFALIPVTFEVTDEFKINLNTGWLYDRTENLHWFTWGAGFEWQFHKPFTLIAEVFGQSGHRDPDEPTLSDPRFQIGLRYTPVEAVDFDVIYGRNINGENANWITVGLSLRFNPGARPADDKKPRLVRK